MDPELHKQYVMERWSEKGKRSPSECNVVPGVEIFFRIIIKFSSFFTNLYYENF